MDLKSSEYPFEISRVLSKPLMAHLSISKPDTACDVPLWFHWDSKALWFISANSGDTFPLKVQRNPRCAVGIVDFDVKSGLLLHIGFRGTSICRVWDPDLAFLLLSKYLGPDIENWDHRFASAPSNSSNLLVEFIPETIVVRNQSYSVVD